MRLMMGDCLERMQEIPDGSVDLVLTDPPYFKVKDEEWDRQWTRPDLFLEWLDKAIEHFQRIIRPGGSVYVFASAKMAGRVELLMSRRLRILNSIVWVKPDAAGAEKGARAGLTRTYVPQTERIIFASNHNPLGDTLKRAMSAAGISALEINRRAFGRSTGIVSLWLCDRDAHGACEPCQVDWIAAMKACGSNVDADDYNHLSRYFAPDNAFSDVWHHNPVRSYVGKHPCEKPIPLLEQIITASTRLGDVVLDAFAGTGSTGVACANTGRKFIGIERDLTYFQIAQQRIEDAQRMLR